MHQGGGVAAPIASQVLGEVLPYMDIKKDNENTDETKNKVVVPEIIGYTFADAKKMLSEMKLNIDFGGDEADFYDEKVISEQLPISGVEVFEDSRVIVK